MNHNQIYMDEEGEERMGVNDIIVKKNYKAQLFRIISISYGLFFGLTGIVLASIEPFKACAKCENDIKIYIEIFFIFMHCVSIIWIVFMFILIIIAKRQQKVAIKNPTGFNRRVSNTFKASNFLGVKFEKKALLSKLIKKKKSIPNQDESINMNEEINDSVNNLSNISRNVSTADLSKFYFTYDYENGTGELYMRVGTAIFSLCAMIDRSLSLVQMIETYFNNHSVILDCKLIFILSIMGKITSVIFIFLQSFFIFKYANIVINFGKNSAVVGLIHIVCTNFCVFFRTVVRETVSEIRHHNLGFDNDHGSYKLKPYSNHITELSKTTSSLINAILPENFASATNEYLLKQNNSMVNSIARQNSLKMRQLGCINTVSFTTDISVGVQEAQYKLAPYLYPCIIEYSLMCMTIFYILWASIEQRYNKHNNYGTWMIGNEEKHRIHYDKNPNISNPIIKHEKAIRINLIQERRHVNQFVIDCGKSTTGLFFGIFVLLLTIISLITYFIYKNSNTRIAVEISEFTELLLVGLSLLIVVMTFIKFKIVKFNYKLTAEVGYNETLVIVGLAGIYLFGFYSIIAILHNGFESNIEILSLSIQIASIIEATIQSILIIDGLKMYTKDKEIKKFKPGRSLVTFLILIDVSLWLSETFSVKKYDMNTIQLDYYDIVFWSIVSSVSSPLAIFFRFHASVCLSDIWKTLYE